MDHDRDLHMDANSRKQHINQNGVSHKNRQSNFGNKSSHSCIFPNIQESALMYSDADKRFAHRKQLHLKEVVIPFPKVSAPRIARD